MTSGKNIMTTRDRIELALTIVCWALFFGSILGSLLWGC